MYVFSIAFNRIKELNAVIVTSQTFIFNAKWNGIVIFHPILKTPAIHKPCKHQMEMTSPSNVNINIRAAAIRRRHRLRRL